MADTDTPQTHAMSSSPGVLPEAVPVRRRRLALGWLLPLLGLGLVGYFGYWAYEQQQFNVELDVADASGIKAFQTPVLCRGVEVGGVTAVRLHPGGRGASVQIRLEPSGLRLATKDSDWWVTRPELSLTAVRDVDALLSGPSIEFRPGAGPAAMHFTAMTGPPADAGMSNGLRLVLRSPGRGSIQPGTPLRYRGVQIGRVVSLRLPQSGQAVMVVLEVDRPYAHLVRTNSVFWHRHDAVANISRLSLGLDGYRVTFPRLNSALDISIDMAVPDQAAEAAPEDMLFELAGEEPKKHWEWHPPLGSGEGPTDPDEAAFEVEPEKPKKRGPIEGLFDLITPFN